MLMTPHTEPQIGDMTTDDPKALKERLAKVEAERDALLREVVQLRQEAMLDPLLPVFNRRAFRRELERGIGLLDRYNIGSTLLYLDIDSFKAINDRYGHAAGDKVLCRVAEALLSLVRVSDSVGRLGGDEFAILLIQTDEAGAKAKIKAIHRAFEDVAVEHAGEVISPRVSVGYTVLVRGDDADQALDRADAAMYRVKRRLI